MKKLVAVVVVLAAIGGAVVYASRSSDSPAGIKAFVPGEVEPFDASQTLPAGPFDARFNRGGTRLAVRSVTGVSLANRGRLRSITESGLEIAAYAWIPSSKPVLIYAEAPGSTGQLRLVDSTDGSSLGFVPLDPVVRVRALSVASDRRHAVLVVAEREEFAARDGLDLVVADLKTGVVTSLAKTAADELDVRHVDDQRVVLRVATATGSEAVLLDLSTGVRTRLSREGEAVEHVDVLGGGRFVAYAARTKPRPDAEPGPAVVWAVAPDGGGHIKMGEAGTSTVVAIDPRGGAAIISDLVAETDTTFSRRLRRIGLSPLPGPPRATAP